jgi:hypothetical protein
MFLISTIFFKSSAMARLASPTSSVALRVSVACSCRAVEIWLSRWSIFLESPFFGNRTKLSYNTTTQNKTQNESENQTKQRKAKQSKTKQNTTHHTTTQHKNKTKTDQN